MKQAHLESDTFLDSLFPWQGERDLLVLFWIYGVALSFVIAALLAGALWTGAEALLQASIPIAGIYTLWVVVAIWRCALHARQLWSTLTRWLTVAWAINAMMVLGFLQFDLFAS